jgi:hypothetical protein
MAKSDRVEKNLNPFKFKKMKPFRILTISALVVVSALVLAAFKLSKPVNQPAIPNKGFALIELFTSEGCSSCPPADELIAKVQKESIAKPVYILAFHVDYWNRLGWKDVFSSADFSHRQNQYANWLHLNSVYTPQVVVNGKTEFVGSEEGNLRNAIKANLDKSATAQLNIANVMVSQEKASASFNFSGAGKNTALLIALVQKTATTKVKNGENGGRTLTHVQIVRQLKSVPLDNQSSINESIILPHNFDPEAWELISFLQNTNTGQIIAATKANFPLTQANASVNIKNTK